MGPRFSSLLIVYRYGFDFVGRAPDIKVEFFSFYHFLPAWRKPPETFLEDELSLRFLPCSVFPSLSFK